MQNYFCLRQESCRLGKNRMGLQKVSPGVQTPIIALTTWDRSVSSISLATVVNCVWVWLSVKGLSVSWPPLKLSQKMHTDVLRMALPWRSLGQAFCPSGYIVIPWVALEEPLPAPTQRQQNPKMLSFCNDWSSLSLLSRTFALTCYTREKQWLPSHKV